MKVMLVNTVDAGSGAARASYRLHTGLLSIGVDSRFLAKTKFSNDDAVIHYGLPYGKIIDKIFNRYARFKKRNYHIKNDVSYTMAIHPDRFSSFVSRYNPDVIHLHWFSKGFIKLESLLKVSQPIVWTLHDMWAFTGGCHYTQGCDKYLNRCGACPVLNSHEPGDLSAEIFQRKEKVYRKISKLHVVTPSHWLGQCAKESSLLKNIPVHVIPNGIDTDLFRPLSREEVRQKWHIPKDKRLILFGALKPTGDPRKGFAQLREALHILSNKDGIDRSAIELMVFGAAESKELPEFGLKINFIGRVNDDRSLAELYSAADVMIVPSLQENLSNTIMESLSCGLPVVAFDIGGNSDMIEHQKCGYLARASDHHDLAHGIEWVLQEAGKNRNLSKNAREKAVRAYARTSVAQKHVDLYQEIM
ncbi:MAG: glycosyltransferase family 4 protein [Cytophagales bacterium]|nr:glycosyltransferase family 4 protein [Cytophagales bacterium]